MDYESVLSKRVQHVKPSGIRKFFDLAASMDDVISLGVGEPDFSTPWSIRKEAIDVLERRKIVYTANSGMIQLRKAVAEYTHRKIHVQYDPEQEIIITVGGSEAIDIAIRALVNPGDEVLIVEPSFVCYAPIVEMTSGVPVPIATQEKNKFKLTAQELKEKITDKTKLLILPFPNNPTGAIMTKEDLEPIAEVLRGTNIMVLSDEIYAELTYGKKHSSIVELDGMQERTILVNGFSKAFAMTGWRLGYVCAPVPIVQQLVKIHQYIIMSSPTVSQYAAINALESCEHEVQRMVREYNIRRRYLVEAFNRIGMTCFSPEGAFYVFPSIQHTGLSSEAFCEKLLAEERVAVVPGNAFGESGEGFVRVSYAYSLRHLMEAVERITRFLNRYGGTT